MKLLPHRAAMRSDRLRGPAGRFAEVFDAKFDLFESPVVIPDAAIYWFHTPHWRAQTR